MSVLCEDGPASGFTLFRWPWDLSKRAEGLWHVLCSHRYAEVGRERPNVTMVCWWAAPGVLCMHVSSRQVRSKATDTCTCQKTGSGDQSM